MRLLPTTCIAVAALLIAVQAAAEPLWAIPNPRVRDGKWVSDETRGLRVETVSRINSAINDLERSTGAEMAVVVIRSLDGISIEDAAARLFDRWGIGKKGRDNGLLLLWSINDRRVRVEVGYGLEGVLPDSKAGAILDKYVIPKFKEGEFDTGIIDGVEALLKAARSEPLDLPLPASGYYERESRTSIPWPLAVGGGIPILVGFMLAAQQWKRRRPRWCPQCRSRMRRLNEAEDDELLEGGQLAEERVGSVDYDVWRCPACAHHYTLRYPKRWSGASKCPQCHHRTVTIAETMTVVPTTASAGTATVTEFCAFCTFKKEYTKPLPMIPRAGSSSSDSYGSLGSTGSSSSGGGGGGSSSSSFGGGRSGGGGASRSY
jgi:uncharacterized protein